MISVRLISCITKVIVSQWDFVEKYHPGDSGDLKRCCLRIRKVYAKIEVSNNRKDDFIWERQ